VSINYEQQAQDLLAAVPEVTEAQLRALRERLAERTIRITLSPAAKKMLAEVGFDPIYGARPLRRWSGSPTPPRAMTRCCKPWPPS